MSIETPSLGIDPGLSATDRADFSDILGGKENPQGGGAGADKSAVALIWHLNGAIDELHIANDLLELMHQATANPEGSHLARGASITQEYLALALARLVTVRVGLGGPNSEGELVAS